MSATTRKSWMMGTGTKPALEIPNINNRPFTTRPQYETSLDESNYLVKKYFCTTYGAGAKKYYLGAIWSRAMSTSELYQLHQNPWQILQPVNSRIITGV